MKKLFMLFAIMSMVGVASVSAQSCTKSKAECTAAASKAASLTADVEKKVCEKSGKVSFVRKSVCEKSGKASYANVEYNTATKKFVNISPSSEKATKAASCTGKSKASAAKGKATAASAKSGASCAKGKATGACCAKGKAKTGTAAAVKKTGVAKAVKTSNQ